jgi:hypothetical protein
MLPVRGSGEQQLNLVVLVEADQFVEVAASQVLLLAIEEFRNAGIEVHHARLQIDG